MTGATGWGELSWGERSWSGLNDDWFVGSEAYGIGGLAVDSETISFEFEITSDSLSAVRAFDRSGDVSVTSGFGGVFFVDDESSDSSIRLIPGDADYPAVDKSAEWYVDDYSETQISPARYTVELVCRRKSNRDETVNRLVETGWSSDGWGDGGWGGTAPDLKIELSYGNLALDEQDIGQIERDGSPVAGSSTLPLLVSAAQLGALADSVGYPNGVVERTIPDGDDRIVDESDADRQTVSITTRSGVDLDPDDGDYIVRGWSAEFYSYEISHRFQIDLTIHST